jgi:hypothetical protein
MTIWKSGLPKAPVITVPTITLEGDANGAPHPDPSSYAKKFSGKYAHRTIKAASGTICRRKRRLADFPGPLLLARGDLQVAAGEVDADAIAVDVVERLVGGNVEAAALHRHDQFDLVMQILGQRRVGDGGAVRHQHVGVLGEEERRRALVIAHLADVLEIVAPDAPDAANRKGFRFADDGKRRLRRGGNDVGCGVHEKGSRRVTGENLDRRIALRGCADRRQT